MDNRSKLLAVAARWYAERKRVRGLPEIHSLDPRHFPTLMQWCLLVAIEPVLMDSRVLICGTGIVTVVHGDWTGRRLGEISLGGIGHQIFTPFATTIVAREPVLVRERRRGRGDIWRSNDRLMLPYATRDSQEVRRLLSITLFDKVADMLMWPSSIDEWEVLESGTLTALGLVAEAS
jgi:hypothetical protein